MTRVRASLLCCLASASPVMMRDEGFRARVDAVKGACQTGRWTRSLFVLLLHGLTHPSASDAVAVHQGLRKTSISAGWPKASETRAFHAPGPRLLARILCPMRAALAACLMHVACFPVAWPPSFHASHPRMPATAKWPLLHLSCRRLVPCLTFLNATGVCKRHFLVSQTRGAPASWPPCALSALAHARKHQR